MFGLPGRNSVREWNSYSFWWQTTQSCLIKIMLPISFMFPDESNEHAKNLRPLLTAVSYLEWDKRLGSRSILSNAQEIMLIFALQIHVNMKSRTISWFITDHGQFFTASELLLVWPNKRFNPRTLTDNMLKIVRLSLLKCRRQTLQYSRHATWFSSWWTTLSIYLFMLIKTAVWQ